jgi:ATP-dependent Zn protease
MSDGSPALNTLLEAPGDTVLTMHTADVGTTREHRRTRRWLKLTLWVVTVVAVLWARALTWDPQTSFVPYPHIDPFLLTIIVFFTLMIGMVIGQQIWSGRSPHVTYRPEQINTTLADVVGIDAVKDDVVRSLNLFLAHKTFSQEMGGTPRRGLLFEGAPGTGKTHLARAMAREAGVPFLFVSATSFQSMWYGATAKKIRSYFKELRKAARKEGGAIGFIEEIDAIAMSRGGVAAGMSPLAVSGCYGTSSLPATYSLASQGMVRSAFMSEGTGGVVNEMLVQMQSFDALTGWQRLGGWLVDRANLLLPVHPQLSRPQLVPTNVLLIAATNRADSLDPALLRPGRFDRRLTFELPGKDGRRALIDHFLTSKAHTEELDEDRRDALAAVTQGYTPVMIEHLLDEALVNAVRRGQREMSWKDVEQARMVEEVGMGQPVGYTPHEKQLIATHEAGHATLAWLTAPERRLEILTIVKRRSALGMLAHGDREDVFTRSRAELQALIQIALGGQCAEQIFFGDVSTGPGGDLLYATNCAAEMVGAHGMDGTLVSYMAIQNSSFSDTNIVGRVLADDRGRDAVEALLQAQKKTAMQLLIENRHLIEALRDALLERHELVGSEITDVLEAAAGRRAPVVVDLRETGDAVVD